MAVWRRAAELYGGRAIHDHVSLVSIWKAVATDHVDQSAVPVGRPYDTRLAPPASIAIEQQPQAVTQLPQRVVCMTVPPLQGWWILVVWLALTSLFIENRFIRCNSWSIVVWHVKIFVVADLQRKDTVGPQVWTSGIVTAEPAAVVFTLIR